MKPSALRVLLLLCVVTTASLGLVKTLWQSAHPPTWVATGGHLFESFVAIDGHAERARCFYDWLRGGEGSSERLLANICDPTRHQTALMVPLLVALLGAAIGSVPVAFLVLSGLGFVLCTTLVVRVARAVAPVAERPNTALLAGIFFAGHCLSGRAALQLHLDVFVTFLALLAVLLTRSWILASAARTAWALFAVQLAGLFCKSSYWPMLALPPLAMCLTAPRAWPRALRAAALFTALPLACMSAYLAAVPGLSTLTSDATHFAAPLALTPGHGADALLELGLLLQWWPLILLIRGRRPSAPWPVMVALLLFAATFIALRFPVVPRLYWPMAALLATIVAPRVGALRSAPALVTFFLLSNYAVVGWILARPPS